MKIGEAVAALGIVQDGGEIVIVRITESGAAHYLLSEVANRDLKDDVYLATGTFAPGSVTRSRGRSAGNLLRINELPFDFDLSDFTGIPKPDLWTMPDAALWPLIEAQREAVEFAFRSIGLTLHRIDYTGYGLAGYLKLPLHKPEAIPAIQALHVRIVERINAIARLKLCDPQVKDAGTRIMRLPGCLNTKGEIHRLSRTLVQIDGLVTEAQLQAAAGATSTAPARIVPATGALLDEATTDQLIAAVQPHWTHGQRHHLALALSGLFAKAGVPEEQALSIIRSLSAGDGDYWDRPITEVHTTYARVRSGQEVKGFFGLKETLPAELIDWLDGIAQRIKQANAPILTAGGRRFEGPSPRAKEDAAPVTPEFFEPPDSAFVGWIGDYCNLVGPTTESPAAFQLGVALTTIGAMMGRQVAVRYNSDPLYSNLFTVLVGRSNKTRKDTAIKRTIRTLTEPITSGSSIMNHGITVVRNVGSSQALLNDLKEHQNVLLYITELSTLIGNARRKGTETIAPTMMEAFDTPTVMQNKAMGNQIEARFPYLSMLAAVQPEILTSLMTSDDMSSGFANRIFFICGSPTAPLPLAPELDWAVMRALFMELWGIRQKYNEGTTIQLSSEAVALWSDWYVKDWHAAAANAEEEALKQRHHVFIMKIALIYAICDQAQSISADHLKRAMDIVAWMWRHVQELSGGWGRSINGQIENRVLSTLERRGAMKRRDLQMACGSRKWSGSEFSDVFERMIKNQLVVVDPFGMVALNSET